ncbi:hypothetical protein CEP54_014627 [Fusarium duplospermum]|uniref:Uncharacterized protein n=1 Tax=Fusarium duplospermum TaxID=1325734 RepID=A0A428NUW5_9HYPO|nr:hypothetical protein CEP54_014627 [Fusarium duplospermum]
MSSQTDQQQKLAPTSLVIVSATVTRACSILILSSTAALQCKAMEQARSVSVVLSQPTKKLDRRAHPIGLEDLSWQGRQGERGFNTGSNEVQGACPRTLVEMCHG